MKQIWIFCSRRRLLPFFTFSCSASTNVALFVWSVCVCDESVCIIVYLEQDESARASVGSCFSFRCLSSAHAPAFSNSHSLSLSHLLSLLFCSALPVALPRSVAHKEPKIKYFRRLHIVPANRLRSPLCMLPLLLLLLFILECSMLLHSASQLVSCGIWPIALRECALQ